MSNLTTDGTWPGLSPARPPRDVAAITGAAKHPPSVPPSPVPPLGVMAGAADGVLGPSRGISHPTVTPKGGSEPVAGIRSSLESRDAYVDHSRVRVGGSYGDAPIPLAAFGLWLRRKGKSTHNPTLPAESSLRICAPKEHPLPATPFPVQVMDDIEVHVDATRLAYENALSVRDVVEAAFADGDVTTAEQQDIVEVVIRSVRSQAQATQTVVPLPAHVARMDATFSTIRSLANTCGFTPAVTRKHRNNVTDLARIEAGALLRFPEMPLDAA